MSNPIGDRNLLFGMFGLKRDIITPDMLKAALNVWISEKGKGLAQILRDMKAINENQHALLEELVDAHLAKHGSDTQKALTAVSLSESARLDFEAIDDPDVRASLAMVPSVEKAPEPEVVDVVTPEVILVVAPYRPAARKSQKPKAPEEAPRRGIPWWVWFSGGAVVAAAFLVLVSAAAVIVVVRMGGPRHVDNEKTPPLVHVKPIVDGGKPNKSEKVDPSPKAPVEEPVVKPAPPPVAPEFVPLFNGKDLAGWKPHKLFAGEWRVENGALIGSNGGRGLGRLFTERVQPKDFHLRVEARFSEKAHGNVFFRALDEDSKGRYEAGFGGFTRQTAFVGGLILQKPEGGSRTFAGAPAARPEPGEWFVIELITEGNRLTTKVNGKEHQNVVEPTLSAAGLIGLTADTKETIEFRRIEIKALSFAAAPPPAVTPDGFVAIFNGKDLSGWKVHVKQPGDWRVKDGILVGAGWALSSLYSERDYQDFHLRVEARINDGGVGGVLSRATFGPQSPLNNPNSPNGFLASINSTGNFIPKTGGMTLIGGKMMSGSQPPPAPGEWFTMEIIGQGPLVKIVMNGKTTANIRDAEGLFARGHIALSVRSPQAVVEFRKIEIKELNAVAAPPVAPPVAAPAEGFVALFNGKDLAGWKPHDREPGEWRVVDGVLSGASKVNGYLFTNRNDYKDFHLRVEARAKVGKTSGLRFRYSPDLQGYETTLNNRNGGMIHIRKAGAPVPGLGRIVTLPPGEWTTLDIIAQGNRLKLLVNGQTTVDSVGEENAFMMGSICLYDYKGGSEFRKIEIKELLVVP